MYLFINKVDSVVCVRVFATLLHKIHSSRTHCALQW